jgi:lipoprotein-releasing system permease protein
MMTFELFISRRYFKSKPKQTIIALITLLSIAGVTIGVTALIVVIAVMEGFETDLKTRIMGIEPHLLIDKKDKSFSEYADVVDIAEQTPGVRAAWPVVELQVMLKSATRVTGAVIKGVDPLAAAKGLPIESLSMLAAPREIPSPEGRNLALPPIIIGRDLARKLSLIQGDPIFVVSPRGTMAPVGFIPFMKRFSVAGFFETGMYAYDGSLAFMRLADAQQLSREKQTVSAVELRVDRIFNTTEVGDQIISRAGASFRYRDWMQLNRNLFSALKLEKAAMFITLTLIILVATFSITSSLVMLVMEKTKDIAILKAMGATQKSLHKVFLSKGVLIGVLGILAGCAAGMLACLLLAQYPFIELPGDVYFLTTLPVQIDLLDMAVIVFGTLVICMAASYFPARQAARMHPVDGIRFT